MYLSELRISNFRRFCTVPGPSGKSEKPGLTVHFNKGLNLLIGENDSGKTAIIDAIKLVILTESRDYIRLEYEDFYTPPGLAGDTDRATSLKIECIFRGFENKHEEAKNFLEWLGIEKNAEGKDQYYLRVFLEGERVSRRVYYDVKAGPDEEGTQLDAKARDLLRAIYLKPLRDAESELIPGKRSRLAQILDAHETFNVSTHEHHLLAVTKKANKAIQNYFKGLGDDDVSKLDDQSGKNLLDNVNLYLTEFFTEKEKNKIANFSISDPNLKSILERLALDLIETKAGLGSYNRLYIAAELLLLRRQNYTGLKLGLIEEIETHLHPQAQLRLIEYLQGRISEETDVQLIMTSHSPNLSSKVNLENLILCKNNNAFSLDSSSTELERGDYLFLQRFLDVTKANLFFAQGVILVEGDAENILMPTIAEIIGKPLSKHGVSIVNVNSTAFLRYSRIFRRKDVAQGQMNIPVAVVTDCDIVPNSSTADEIKRNRAEKEARYNGQGVKTFISPVWTLEYDICLSGLKRLFYKAVLRAEKIQNSNQIGLTDEKIKEVDHKVHGDFDSWKANTDEEIANEIYVSNMKKNNISKAIVAQNFAGILKNEDRLKLQAEILKDQYLKYLVDAINYACG